MIFWTACVFLIIGYLICMVQDRKERSRLYRMMADMANKVTQVQETSRVSRYLEARRLVFFALQDDELLDLEDLHEHDQEVWSDDC